MSGKTKMRERKRKHDDAHWPLQGKGKRSRRKSVAVYHPCPDCKESVPFMHMCKGGEK